MTVQAVRAYQLADEFRRRGAKVVMGGIHATLLPEEAMTHADVVIAGEGEPLFPQFLQDYAKGKTRRVYREALPGSYDLKQCISPRYALLKGGTIRLLTCIPRGAAPAVPLLLCIQCLWDGLSPQSKRSNYRGNTRNYPAFPGRAPFICR